MTLPKVKRYYTYNDTLTEDEEGGLVLAQDYERLEKAFIRLTTFVAKDLELRNVSAETMAILKAAKLDGVHLLAHHLIEELNKEQS